MGKKRQPLRKVTSSPSKITIKPTISSKTAISNSDKATNISSNSRPKVNKKEDDDDDELWAKIEADDEAAARDEDEDDDNDDEDDDNDEINIQGAVEHISEEYTFEFNDMRDDFANGICTLLRSIVVNPTDAYTLASSISVQTIVGTTIVCEGEHDVFAFATVLPIAKQKSGPLFMILEHLRRGIVTLNSTARSPGIELMAECISGAQGGVTGIFLHQRFSNLPLELISHLHRNLDEDVGWAQQLHDTDTDGNAAQEASEFKSLQFVILLACCDIQGPKQDIGSSAIDVSGSSSLLFHNFEDESYFQEAISTVLFKPPQSEHRLCASLIPVASMKKCHLNISSLIGDSTQPKSN